METTTEHEQEGQSMRTSYGFASIGLAVAILLLASSPVHGMYRDGMNLYQYVRSQPCNYLDPYGQACCDQCQWGAIKDATSDEVRFAPAERYFSPGVLTDAEAALRNARTIQTLSAFANAGSAAARGLTESATKLVTKLSESLTRTYVGGAMSTDIDTALDFMKGRVNTTQIERSGLAIWVHVKYNFCEWDRCGWKPWTGANDWHYKEKWHRCSANGSGMMSGGFMPNELGDMAKAVGSCVKEALTKP